MSKEYPILFSGPMVKAILEGHKTQTRRVIKDIERWDKSCLWDGKRIGKPIGEVEFFYYDKCGYTKIEPPYGRPGDLLWVRETFMEHYGESKVWYKASQSEQSLALLASFGKWMSPVCMPRWASRITLLLKAVRVERVQDITEADAKAEGVDNLTEFILLWDSINLKRGYSWEVNPLVWVLEFQPQK